MLRGRGRGMNACSLPRGSFRKDRENQGSRRSVAGSGEKVHGLPPEEAGPL